MLKPYANDARILREVAKALREWGRKAGPSGRDPSTVADEEREAARQALLLAVKNLDLIHWACNRYGCAAGVIGVQVFDKLREAASAHDRGHDLGDYWVWVGFLTGKQLCGGIEVSFPDELVRWASRLEQEPAEGGQAERKKPHKEKRPKDRFSFAPGQVFFDDHDLDLATGLPIEVLRKLISRFGRTVRHQNLHAQSTISEASPELRHAIRVIGKALKAKKTGYQVHSKRGEGYVLS